MRTRHLEAGGRRSGLTLDMVRQLPATGSVVVVHTEAMQRYVEQMIHDLRGFEVAQLTKVICLTSRSKAAAALTGRRVPIQFDHAFKMAASFELLSFSRALASASNAQFPNAAPLDA